MGMRNKKAGVEARPRLNREKLREAAQVFRFIRPYRWPFIFGLVLLFLSSLVFMIFPYLSGLMVDVAQGNAELDISLG